jgi:uncharacterized lipoprotein NlpE involved in copper resistance
MKRAIALCFLVSILALVGCENEPKREETLRVDQLPKAALEGAQKSLPGYKFNRAWKVTKAGKAAFEVQGQNTNGKVRDVCVTSEGEVLEVD